MNPFSSSADVKNQEAFARLNPGTFESVEALLFDDNLKLALWIGGVVLALLVLTAVTYRRLRIWPWIGGVLGGYVVAAAVGFWVSSEKHKIAETSLQDARKKAAAAYEPEPYKFPPPSAALPEKPIVVPPGLVPEPPQQTTIDLNCSSISAGAVTCSGTSTSR